jgi:hypothetical protein
MIITSRNPRCQQYSTVGAKEVGRMTSKDTLALLTKTVCGVAVEPDHSHNHQDKVGLQVVQNWGVWRSVIWVFVFLLVLY